MSRMHLGHIVFAHMMPGEAIAACTPTLYTMGPQKGAGSGNKSGTFSLDASGHGLLEGA